MKLILARIHMMISGAHMRHKRIDSLLSSEWLHTALGYKTLMQFEE